MNAAASFLKIDKLKGSTADTIKNRKTSRDNMLQSAFSCVFLKFTRGKMFAKFKL